MKEFIKTLLNNLDERTYWNAKTNHDLYDKDGIVASKLDKDGKEWEDLELKAISLRRGNRERLFKLIKKFIRRGAYHLSPYIISLVLFYIAFTNDDVVKEIPIYQKHTVEFDREFLYEDTIDEKEYYKSSASIAFHKPIIELESCYTDKAYFYVGEGKDSRCINYQIDDNNDWRFLRIETTNNLWQNEEEIPIQESKQVNQIIDDAIDLYLESHIDKEIFTDQDLRMKIEYYEEIRKEIVEFKEGDLWNIIGYISAVITPFTYWDIMKKKAKKPLESIAKGDVFKHTKKELPFLIAYRNYTMNFVKAEHERIKNMVELLEEYSLNEEEQFLSPYEREYVKSLTAKENKNV